MIPLRNTAPIRSEIDKTYVRYRSYKKFLIKDFNHCCAYCDDHDMWSGGPRSFHVDHFAPAKPFADLLTVYDNLMYSCAFCNIAKSNKWPSKDNSAKNISDDRKEGFLHPINDDYNKEFYRNDDGSISPVSDLAGFMITELKLDLLRHPIIWNLTRLVTLIDRYEQIFQDNKLSRQEENKLMKNHYMLLRVFYIYHNKLREVNNKI